MELDKTGLQSRIFDVYSITGKRSYIFLCNMETNISRWSKNAVEYFGLPDEYMYDAGSIWENYIHPEDIDKYRRNFEAVFSGKTEWQDFEYRARNRYGNYVVCTCQCTILKGEEGEPDLFSGTIINHGIIDSIDPVTNLYSDYSFLNELINVIDKNIPIAVMEIGINLFSRINLMYGYSNGNQIMRRFGEEIKCLINGKGTVYRLDGAKFAVCMYGYSEEDAESLYGQIVNIAKEKIYLQDFIVPLKISGGAVVLNNYKGSVESIKSSIAYAFNQSKHEKHGKLVFYYDYENNRESTDLELMSKIHKSVNKGCQGFYLRYQPIVDVKSEKVIGMEALVRWRHEDHGEVSPNLFIPWMEDDPSFFELGNWIIKKALTDGMRLKKKIPEFIVNVNISLSQFERAEFRNSVLKILDETGFPPEDLYMELTERCRGLDRDFLREEMNFFRSMGVKIALDDFGTGTASLGLLTELPIDELKIDMSFVRGIEKKPVNQALIHHMVECAKTIGVKTCIEGVENRPLSEYLDKYKATFYQGYYYSKPVAIDDFEKLLS